MSFLRVARVILVLNRITMTSKMTHWLIMPLFFHSHRRGKNLSYFFVSYFLVLLFLFHNTLEIMDKRLNVYDVTIFDLRADINSGIG